MPVACTCEHCGNTFYCQPSRVSRRTHCSRECYRAAGWNASKLIGTHHTPKVDATTYFWSKVRKTAGCWFWIGTLSRDRGYGCFNHARNKYLAHRYSYELAYGPIPEGLFVLHHCDIPNCVNPDHLFVGTIADNVHDCIAKGRRIYGGGGAKGTENGSAKLTDAQVISIRASTDKAGSLATRFGVTPSTISKIRLRRSWKHVK